MTHQVEELSDGELDDANGGMIFVKIPGLGDKAVTSSSELAAQPVQSTAMNGKGNSALTEEIEMVIERLERG